MFDPYERDVPGSADPATNIFAITPHDVNQIQFGIKALRIRNPAETAATIAVKPVNGTKVILGIPPLALLIEPLRVSMVYATDTTAGLEIHGYTDTN